jgi:hypothetical protein
MSYYSEYAELALDMHVSGIARINSAIKSFKEALESDNLNENDSRLVTVMIQCLESECKEGANTCRLIEQALDADFPVERISN